MITEPVRARTEQQLLIGGEWRDSVSGETFETRNPATGELLATVAAANDRDVDEAVAAAWRAATRYGT